MKNAITMNESTKGGKIAKITQNVGFAIV